MPDYFKWDELEKLSLIDTSSKANKLKIASVAWKYRNEGNSVINISKVVNVNNSTLKDWMTAYETYKNLSPEASEKLSITKMKEMCITQRRADGVSGIVKIRPKKDKVYKKNTQHEKIVKPVIKKESNTKDLGFYGLYRKLKTHDFPIGKVKKIYFLAGLVMAEAKNQLGITSVVNGDFCKSDDFLEDCESNFYPTYDDLDYDKPINL